ncbi:putative TRAF3-interacting protein 1-like [Trypanosoma grayi]|uniref:putative TRAF3-interacting protein 1-like n=1 Tax=Trypanosoma grayi TaxID=71804 RepID=UPI0004F4154E|nr:putative TRAF3-interacting protein 1-like [Trypanosoma grayi]KEG15373.1 putative TRAF3-interacting protein 1-like [Trypanosoma grayi]
MGDTEVDFWTPTIEAFAPLQLDGPELTPKLLKRPPFRFIADIVTSINTRFAAYDHIFRPEQLDPANIDNKEKKTEYLTTLVKYVGSLLGIKIDVNVKKILSGSEPEKTNVFLQYLAMAVGYAQQDKAKRTQELKQQEQQQQQQQEQQQQGTATTVPPMTSSTTMDAPRQKSMPRRISNPSERAAKKVEVLREASEFYNKINSYGLLKLDQPQSVKEVGQSIVDMFRGLQQEKMDIQPTSLPVDALETAIKRQIESIQQVSTLEEENNTVIEKLEVLLTS